MAYTQGVFEADSATGDSAIYLVDPLNPSDRTPFTDPTNNRTRILFHSAFDYLKVVYDQTISVTFPVAPIGETSSTHSFPDHNLGVIPHGICKWGSAEISGTVSMHSDASGIRNARISLSTTGAAIEAFASAWASLPSVTHTFRLILLGTAAVVPAADKFLIDAEAGVVQFGQGKFQNTGGRHIRITNDAVPLMYLNKIGPSMDSLGKGMRIVASDGTVSDVGGYAGSFVATGAHKVKV